MGRLSGCQAWHPAFGFSLPRLCVLSPGTIWASPFLRYFGAKPTRHCHYSNPQSLSFTERYVSPLKLRPDYFFVKSFSTPDPAFSLHHPWLLPRVKMALIPAATFFQLIFTEVS